MRFNLVGRIDEQNFGRQLKALLHGYGGNADAKKVFYQPHVSVSRHLDLSL